MTEIRWINQEKIGETYRASEFEVTAEEARAYACAVCDENPRYMDADRKDACAPPMYAVRPLMRVLEAVLYDESLNVDMLRLVHGEQDMRFARPLRLGEVVVPTAEVLSAEDKGSGQLLRVRQWLHVGSEEVCDTVGSYFIRHPAPPAQNTTKKPKKAKKPHEVRPDPSHTVDHDVDAERAKIYAAASGDANAIHLDPEVARAAGLPGVILHGLCTMAFAGQAVVDALLQGDPKRLKRLRVRFARPVLLEQTLQTKLWSVEEEGRAEFLVEDEHGTPVVVQGIAEFVHAS